MPSSTTHGFPYVDPEDALTDYPATMESLAEAIEADRIGRIIRGEVSSSGGIVRGIGFTVARTGVGLYTITFTVPFAVAPVVTGTARRGVSATGVFEQINSPTVDHADVGCLSGGNIQFDLDFDFIAMEVDS